MYVHNYTVQYEQCPPSYSYSKPLVSGTEELLHKLETARGLVDPKLEPFAAELSFIYGLQSLPKFEVGIVQEQLLFNRHGDRSKAVTLHLNTK
jgi:hypothetical protein